MDDYELRGPYETLTNTRDNEDTYNGIPIHDRFTGSVMRYYSRRTGPIKSNHRDPTPYSRVVGSCLGETPYRLRKDSERKTGYLSLDGFSVDDFWVPSGVAPLLDNAESRSITIARDRLRGDNSFDLGVTIAESRQTAEMLAETGTRMVGGLKAFRQKLNLLPPGARRKAQLFAGAWLEGYYGWGSLARDAFALDNKLRNNVKEPLIIRASATSKDKFSDAGEVNAVVDLAMDVEVISKVGYRASIDSAVIRGIDNYGLLNPLSIAWELVPYSFCIDWIMPIGNVLSSLSATAGLKFESGYATRVTKSVKTFKYHNKNGWTSEVTEDAGSYVIGQTVFNRRLLNAFELPQLYANQNPFSTNRILSAISLIAQAQSWR